MTSFSPQAFLETGDIDRAIVQLKTFPSKFINARKLARKTGLTTPQCLSVFRLLDFPKWSDAKRVHARTCFVIPKKYRA